MARESADDAAELDRAVRRARGCSFRAAAKAGVGRTIEVFTTRIDTIFGATFVLARARASAGRAVGADEPATATRSRARRARFRTQDRTARMTGEVEKEGFFTGRHALNPFTGEHVPIWVANFVLGRVRHRRGHGGAGARSARLRVRDEVRPADQGRRRSRTDGGDADGKTMTEAVSRRRRARAIRANSPG